MSADTATSVDWALLEADMPSIPCEWKKHSSADQAWCHGGNATHYYRTKCPACMRVSDLLATCTGFIKAIIEANATGTCTGCKHRAPVREFTQTLQPIRSNP